MSKSSIFFSTQIWPIFVITLRNDQNISDLFSERFCFSDWPNHSIPMVSAGVYVVWQGDLLIYAGMSGRQTEKNLGKKKIWIDHTPRQSCKREIEWRSVQRLRG